MPSVFFNISEQQEKEVKSFMAEEGYTSKAEFFRFLVKFFKYHKSHEEKRFEKASADLSFVLRKLDQEGKLGSLASIDDQLADV